MTDQTEDGVKKIYENFTLLFAILPISFTFIQSDFSLKG